MATATIHPTAILDGDIALAEGVEIGPYCVLRGAVRIGAFTRLVAHVVLEGPLVLGARNTLLYPFVALGLAPQDLKWPADKPGAGLVIGDDNVFREHATIHRATSDSEPTRVGSHTYWMACSHAGHDCRIGDYCIFANGTLLAGAVEIAPRVITGGNVAIHQFCRIGRGAMLCGTMGLNKDLPPFFMLTGGNVAGSLNLVGMRRGGLSSSDIAAVKWVYRTLYHRGRVTLGDAAARLRERAGEPIVDEYIAFVEGSRRGICASVGDPRRGTAGGDAGE